MKLRFLLITVIGLLFSNSICAQQLLQWNTFGNSGTESTELSIANDVNVAAANLTLGPGINGAGNANRFGGSDWWNAGDSNPSTLAQAVAGNDYIQFVVTPGASRAFTATSLQFNWDKSGTGPQNVALRSSVDGFASNLGTVAPTAAIATLNTITISGLTNLTSATTFRLYGYGATATGGTGGFDIGTNTVNVVLNGTTTVLAGFVTAQAGPWTTPATWVGGVVPTAGDSVSILHAVTDNVGITRNVGTTSTIFAGASLTASAGYVNNGTTTVNGTFFMASNLTINVGSSFVVNGSFRINGGIVVGNAPTYGNASFLIYNSGAAYSRGIEWSAVGVGTIGVTPGYPHNVNIGANTMLNYNNGATAARAMNGMLNIAATASLLMNNGGGPAGGSLTVGGDATIAGNLTLGTAVGDDLRLGGTSNISGAGVINANNRTVYFIKSGTQGFFTQFPISLPKIVLASGNTIVRLSNPGVAVTITGPAGGGDGIVFTGASDAFDILNGSLIIGAAGLATTVSGPGAFRGSATATLTLLGTGSVGTLNFAVTQSLSTFTINRTAGAVAATLGTPLTITTDLNLTDGLLDVGNNPLTIAGTITNASPTNYIIADLANGTSASLRKIITANGVNIPFPIGDSAGSADGSQYSPVNITVTAASYPANSYVGVAVNDIKHPNYDAATEFITRYWDITGSGMTTTVFNASGTYLDTDINTPALEANYQGNKWNGTAWSNAGTLVNVGTNATNAIPCVVGAINNVTAGRRNQDINVVQVATNYLTGSTYDFGTVLVGNTNAVTFTIQNIGQQNLTIAAAAPAPVAPYVYTPYTTPGSMVTGGTRPFTVTFTPTGAGTFTGSITIPSNDPDEPNYVINFTGVGQIPTPEINLKGFTGGTNSIPNGSVTITGLNNTSFGNTAIGSPLIKDFEIQNTGSAVLNLTGTPYVTLGGINPGDFSVTTAPATGTIAAASSTTFIITFTPTASGTRSAVVSIANNDSDENPYTYLIQGTGNCATATNTITPASGPVGTEVIITASANNLIGATATFNGISAVVTQVSPTQIKAIVPVGATSGNLITTNGQGCTASNPFTVIDNAIASCQGGTPVGELFISEVTDANNGGLSYVEIYNGTTAGILLPNYGLRVANNGGGYSFTTGLTGAGFAGAILPAGASYIVALGDDDSCGTPGGNGSYANQSTGGGGVNFVLNEHDHIALFRLSVQVDSWGTFGSTSWAPAFIGTNGVTFRRKKTAVTLPNVTYSNADWDIIDFPGTLCGDNDYTDIGTYDFSRGTPPTVTQHPAYIASCKATSFTVAGTEGFVGGNPLAYQWFAIAPGVASPWTSLSNAGVYTGVTTPTLSISNIAGLDGYQFYCQIRENGATCFTATNAVTIAEGQTVTWNGTAWTPSTPTSSSVAIINGNYNTAANGSFEACSLTVNGTFTLTIAAADYVEIQNDLTVNASGSLQVQNNGSLVMVSDSGVVTNNGTTQVYRTTTPYKKFDYTYWSSPVVNSTIGAPFSLWRTDYAFLFNTANFIDLTGPNGIGGPDAFDDNSDAWQNVTNATVMAPAKGYAIMAPTTGTFPTSSTVMFSGAVNNGQITIPIALSGNPASNIDDYNLIGNPYPSAVFADDFINENTDISGTLYLWTHVTAISPSAPGPGGSNFITQDYAMYNLSGGTASATGSPQPTGMIASAQGFLIDAQAASSVTFTNAMRSKSHDNSDFFRSSNQALGQKDRIWLNLKNDYGLFSQQLIGYFNQATLGVDRGYDGIVNQTENTVSFYSFIGTDKYRIQGRSSFTESDIVPLGYATGYAGMYTIDINNKEGQLDAPETNIYLEDTQLQLVHDLKQGPYNFTTTAGVFNNRFVLRYTNQLGNDDFDTFENSVAVAVSENQIRVKSESEPITKVSVYDILGRTILDSKSVSGRIFTSAILAIEQQALIVKVTLENGQVVTRKVQF